LCGRRAGEDEESFPEAGRYWGAASKNTELLEDDRIKQTLRETLLSAPDTGAASLGAGALKAALKRQPSLRRLWEASPSEPSSPNPCRETACTTYIKFGGTEVP